MGNGNPISQDYVGLLYHWFLVFDLLSPQTLAPAYKIKTASNDSKMGENPLLIPDLIESWHKQRPTLIKLLNQKVPRD